MKEIEILTYTPDRATEWDEFVCNSRNGTFLLQRCYIDYHDGRLQDCSLMVYLNGKLSALLPANLDGNTLRSHGGLTYGGLVLPLRRVDGAEVLQILSSICDWCRLHNIDHLVYKPIPWIFHRRPSQEDLYALFRLGARRTVCNLSSSIYLPDGFNFDMSKRQQVRKADKLGLQLIETDDYAPFWQLLEQCLADRHDAKPVHTLQEIALLHSRFPNNIRLHTVCDDEGIQAGIVIFDTGTVAHSQYTASTPKARKNYYVTWLYHRLLTEAYPTRRYFDYGTSNNDAGQVLDEGLLSQKFSLGGTGVAYEQYTIKVKDKR